jgi:hypothetical protein
MAGVEAPWPAIGSSPEKGKWGKEERSRGGGGGAAGRHHGELLGRWGGCGPAAAWVRALCLVPAVAAHVREKRAGRKEKRRERKEKKRREKEKEIFSNIGNFWKK